MPVPRPARLVRFVCEMVRVPLVCPTNSGKRTARNRRTGRNGMETNVVGVAVCAFNDIRVIAPATGRTVVEYTGDSDVRAISVQSAAVAPDRHAPRSLAPTLDALATSAASAPPVAPAGGAGPGSGDVVLLDFTLLPALLRSKRLPEILASVFGVSMNRSGAEEVLDALKAEAEAGPGDKAGKLGPLDRRLCDIVSRHPRVHARRGSLVLKWTGLEKEDGTVLAAALDGGGVSSSACVALAHLLLWVLPDEPVLWVLPDEPVLWATKCLTATVASSTPLGRLRSYDRDELSRGAHRGEGFPSE